MTNLQIIRVVLLPELGHIHFPVTDHGGSVPMPDRMASDEIQALPKYLTAVGPNSVLFIVTMGTLFRTEPGFFALWNNHCSGEPRYVWPNLV